MKNVHTRAWVLLILALLAVVLVMWRWLRPVTMPVSVYFIRVEGTVSTLQEVRRIVNGRRSSDFVSAALQEVLAGPTPPEQEAGLVTAIPRGTRLRSVQIRDGIVIADFGSEVESGGGSASMLGRFWQIVYTATQFSQALRVRILIDGQERVAMGGEGVLIDRPIARPPTVPRF